VQTSLYDASERLVAQTTQVQVIRERLDSQKGSA